MGKLLNLKPFEVNHLIWYFVFFICGAISHRTSVTLLFLTWRYRF